jgi:hypothetical protein
MVFNQFHSYRQKIIFPEEKNYFDGIMKLYSSKQYRSAYIMTWVMLVEALRYRIVMLADSGENSAIKLIAKIENMEKQKLSVDKEVIDGAKALSLIDDEDLGYFDIFWTKRCIFVHPYKKMPSKAEVETIIKICVDKVLSIPAFHRKAFIESEIQNLYIKHYLVSDTEEIKEYIDKMLTRINQPLYPFFFKSVLAEIGKNINVLGKDDVLNKFSLYLQGIYKASSEENIRNNFRIDFYIVNYPDELIFGLATGDIWRSFDEDLKNKIIQYVSENIKNEKYHMKSNQRIIELVVNNVIEKEECRELVDRLESLYFWILKNFVPFSNILLKSMLNELETNNFERVSSVITYIEHIEYDAYEIIDDLLLLKLGKLLLFNAVQHSWAAQSFIVNLSGRINIIHYKIVIGMLFYQFYMYDMNLNFNLSYLNYIISYFNITKMDIDYRHWFELYKETIPINFANDKKTLDAYIKDAENIGQIGQDELVKIKQLFSLQ